MDLTFLTERYPEALARINTGVERSKDPDLLKHYVGFIALDNITVALYKMFVEQNFEAARDCFYKASMCDAYEIMFHDKLMHTSIFSICYALLSDSKYSISMYKNLMGKVVNDNFIGHQFNTAIQAILKDDKELLDQEVSKFEKQLENRKWITYKGCIDVFKGIGNKDHILLERGLNELLKTHNKREGHEFIKKFFSVEISALAKLAKIKGIDFTIDSPFVPKQLLQISELNKYSTYDFLRDV